MEKLDAACMLIQTIGENIKTINEKTEGKLFVQYPEIPWKRGSKKFVTDDYHTTKQKYPYNRGKKVVTFDLLFVTINIYFFLTIRI